MTTNIDMLHDRYLNDVLFHNVVETMYRVIDETQMTPAEMRDAVWYASLKYEMEYNSLIRRTKINESETDDRA